MIASTAALACACFAEPAFADGGGMWTGGAMVAANGEVMLKRGDRGPAVAILQRRLGITADGVFGPITERAVKRYQRRHGLVADGIVGPITRGSLGLKPFSANAVQRSVRMPRVMRRIAECESGGNPRAVSPGGTYRGKYQFTRATWRSLGGRGDPADAPEWLQDRLALKLYRMRGTAPWPACSKRR
ncbi:MAG TPA: transglycosylase family protein [Thermoleophilaceae bacterium]|nr:transglycosylase family protein [Thermoleophilaceae bacterium]